MIDRRWHSCVLDVQSLSGADSDTDHYLVIAKVRERLAVGNQAAQRFDRQRFNFLFTLISNQKTSLHCFL